MATTPREPARTQALCWLLDDLLDAEDDLLALVARPGALPAPLRPGSALHSLQVVAKATTSSRSSGWTT
jgi:hypothetical protein